MIYFLLIADEIRPQFNSSHGVQSLLYTEATSDSSAIGMYRSHCHLPPCLFREDTKLPLFEPNLDGHRPIS